MKKIIISVLSLSFFLLCLSSIISAQSSRALFLGLQPGLTKEKFYEKNEFDINVVPLVFQLSLNKRIDIRIVTLANYHFGDEQQFSDVGLLTSLPVFIFKKEALKDASSGFFIGPHIGVSKNLLNEHYTTNIALEPGYMFSFSDRFAISAYLQYGGSYFAYHDGSSKWEQHFGIKVDLGIWLN